MKANHCGFCGEEVRHGTRSGFTGWLHREDKDHRVALGTVYTAEMAAEVERQLDLPRFRLAPGVASKCPTYQALWPLEEYTAREHDLVRYRKKKSFRESEEFEEGDEPVVTLPPIEIYAHDIDPAEFAPRSGIRQVINLIPKQGWDLVSVRHSRGPYVGSSGESLSISDVVVVKARGPQALDGGTPVAVASWRDGKFDFAYVGTILGGRLAPRKVDATTMKNWIKGI